MKHLIVGIDPGTTVGLAFLDVNGDILKVMSERNLPIDGIITHIAAAGKAAMVACDKQAAPPVVSKVAAITSARVFTPGEDLGLDRKREIVQSTRFRTRGMDAHQTDALAAAVYAYNHFQNKLRRVEKQVGDQLEQIKARVLRGEKVSDIADAWVKPKVEKAPDPQVNKLKKENADLRARLRRSSRGSSTKSVEQFYEKELARAGRILDEVGKGDLVFLKHASSLTYNGLKEAGVARGDIVVTGSKQSDAKGVRYLEARGAQAVVCPAGVESLVPCIDPNDLDIERFRGFFFADPKQIKDQIADLSKKGGLNEAKLEGLLKGYRTSRG